MAGRWYFVVIVKQGQSYVSNVYTKRFLKVQEPITEGLRWSRISKVFLKFGVSHIVGSEVLEILRVELQTEGHMELCIMTCVWCCSS
jgi:hypothetical protein